jgi:hypothetical protein
MTINKAARLLASASQGRFAPIIRKYARRGLRALPPVWPVFKSRWRDQWLSPTHCKMLSSYRLSHHLVCSYLLLPPMIK